MTPLIDLPAWKALQKHHQSLAYCHMRDWFMHDPLRFNRFSLRFDDLLFDYSKNRITDHTRQLLVNLAEECHLADHIEALFSGKEINSTENRPALHTALRDRHCRTLTVNHENIMPLIQTELDKISSFVQQVHEQSKRGITGQPIRDIVTIGLGGSHLGPLMACHALSDYAHESIRCYFISNIDGAHLSHVLQQIDPEKTLFIVSSKSFSTFETITNAKTIKAWLQQQLGQNDVSAHFAAVTAKPELATEFGVPDAHIFRIWDWVGGRYSIWSAIGLPLALSIGMDNFLAFLDGAHAMDQHFRTQPFSQNIPVLLGLLGIWYINFFGATHHVITPYSHQLTYLRKYIQQADMESNGKVTTHVGHQTNYLTAPVIFGEQGCDGQHSYHQFLHQGPHFIPVDFILVGNNNHFDHHQDILIASGLSQAQALMQGKTFEMALREAHADGYEGEAANHIAMHKTTPGNRPSNILFLKKITPCALGTLIALYEHKIFVQGAIWRINSFDQWGIELGKQLLPEVLSQLKNNPASTELDSSTLGLTEFYKQTRAPA